MHEPSGVVVAVRAGDRPPRPEEDEAWLDQLAPAAAEPEPRAGPEPEVVEPEPEPEPDGRAAARRAAGRARAGARARTRAGARGARSRARTGARARAGTRRRCTAARRRARARARARAGARAGSVSPSPQPTPVATLPLPVAGAGVEPLGARAADAASGAARTRRATTSGGTSRLPARVRPARRHAADRVRRPRPRVVRRADRRPRAVTLSVLQRTVALAAVALLAAVAALALSRETSGGDTGPGEASTGHRGGDRLVHRARRLARRRRGTPSGRRAGGSSRTARSASRHPVLPCGVKIYIAYGGTEVLTEVIDSHLKRPGPPVRADGGARAAARHRRHAADPLAVRAALGQSSTRWHYTGPARPCTWPCA